MALTFDVRNLRNMRAFYQAFPNRNALRTELSWTHYRALLRVESPRAREWYMAEAADQHWSSRALERQIGTLYYERLLSSQDRTAVQQEAENQTRPLSEQDALALASMASCRSCPRSMRWPSR